LAVLNMVMNLPFHKIREILTVFVHFWSNVERRLSSVVAMAYVKNGTRCNADIRCEIVLALTQVLTLAMRYRKIDIKNCSKTESRTDRMMKVRPNKLFLIIRLGVILPVIRNPEV
jgi:hypothetical protein